MKSADATPLTPRQRPVARLPMFHDAYAARYCIVPRRRFLRAACNQGRTRQAALPDRGEGWRAFRSRWLWEIWRNLGTGAWERIFVITAHLTTYWLKSTTACRP